MKNEIEAKFLAVNKDTLRLLLQEAGFTLQTSEYLMRRKTFDFVNQTGKKKWGRVRQESDSVTMAIKEIRGLRIDDVYEVELIVNDFDTACAFLEACDIHEKSFQENYREVWTGHQVEITIDTWPGLEPFIEIEGPDETKVRETSEKLGFDFTKAVFGSIDLVYEKESGIPAKDILVLPMITFENPPKKKAA